MASLVKAETFMMETTSRTAASALASEITAIRQLVMTRNQGRSRSIRPGSPIMRAASKAITMTGNSHRASPLRSSEGNVARRTPVATTARAIGHRGSPTFGICPGFDTSGLPLYSRHDPALCRNDPMTQSGWLVHEPRCCWLYLTACVTTRSTRPKNAKSSHICTVTTRRAASFLAVMSPKPTVVNTVEEKYIASVRLSGTPNACRIRMSHYKVGRCEEQHVDRNTERQRFDGPADRVVGSNNLVYLPDDDRCEHQCSKRQLDDFLNTGPTAQGQQEVENENQRNRGDGSHYCEDGQPPPPPLGEITNLRCSYPVGRHRDPVSLWLPDSGCLDRVLLEPIGREHHEEPDTYANHGEEHPPPLSGVVRRLG